MRTEEVSLCCLSLALPHEEAVWPKFRGGPGPQRRVSRHSRGVGWDLSGGSPASRCEQQGHSSGVSLSQPRGCRLGPGTGLGGMGMKGTRGSAPGGPTAPSCPPAPFLWRPSSWASPHLRRMPPPLPFLLVSLMPRCPRLQQPRSVPWPRVRALPSQSPTWTQQPGASADPTPQYPQGVAVSLQIMASRPAATQCFPLYVRLSHPDLRGWSWPSLSRGHQVPEHPSLSPGQCVLNPPYPWHLA